MEQRDEQLYLVLISIHGLIRGRELELGRDADTGGQTRYVVELARALGEHPDVRRVDLLTQSVHDSTLSSDYAQPEEELSRNVRIVRFSCGDGSYLPKEELWDCLDGFIDDALHYLQNQDRPPQVIHAHYADAGYVGSRLAGQLGLPLIFTGHSLGRVKRSRLLAAGFSREKLEERYKISRRIAAEESTLGTADLVITSTRQEVESQYQLYDYYRPEQMKVVPPGVDLQGFFPPLGNERRVTIYQQLRRFLQAPEKPMILALSRPDARKNIGGLLRAYGESRELQRLANLVIVAGNRNDVRDMDPGPQEVLTDILLTIDQQDLYGRVAYPKHHRADDVSVLYRLAALSRGVFINPALTEPFGLTLLEAAASGLPIVATDDGGPTDIINNCRNGELIDPLSSKAITAALLRVLSNRDRWDELAANGLSGVREHYSWESHTTDYVPEVKRLLLAKVPEPSVPIPKWSGRFRDRAVFSDLDKTLLGDRGPLKKFIELVEANRKRMTFGIATGRRLDSALRVMREYDIPRPDVLITSLGTDIYYAPSLTQDVTWRSHIDHLWNSWAVKRLLSDLPGLELQPKRERGKYKISYYYDPALAPGLEEIEILLRQNEQTVNMTLSFGQYLDIVPVRASKGAALRWFAAGWDVPLERVLVAGGSGADEDMMRGNTLAVVVANRHHEELSSLTDIDRVLLAKKSHAAGILEAIDHYDFFGDCRNPES